MAIKFGVNLATPNQGGRDGSIATQKTNILSSLFHNVPRMARSAASQPLLLAGPLDAGPLRRACDTGACTIDGHSVHSHDSLRGGSNHTPFLSIGRFRGPIELGIFCPAELFGVAV